MKTTRFTTVSVLAISLFLGGCGSHLSNAMGAGGPGSFSTIHTDDRSPHATLDWNAALNPIGQPSRTAK